MPTFHAFVKEHDISFEFDTIQDHHDLFITHLKGTKPFHIVHRRNAITLDQIGEGVKDYIESMRRSRTTSALDMVGLGATSILDDFEEDVDDAIEKANDFADTKDKKAQAIGELVRALGTHAKFGAVGQKQIVKTLKQASKLIEHAQENEFNNTKIGETFDTHEKMTEHIMVRVLKALKNGVKNIVTWIKDLVASIFSSVGTAFGKVYEFITANRGRVLAIIALCIWVGYRIYTDGWETLSALVEDTSALTNYLMGLFKSVWDGSSVESWFIWLKDISVNEYYILAASVPGDIGKNAIKQYTLTNLEKGIVLKRTAQHLWSAVGDQIWGATVGASMLTYKAAGIAGLKAGAASTLAAAGAVSVTPVTLGVGMLTALWSLGTVTTERELYILEQSSSHWGYIYKFAEIVGPIVSLYLIRKLNLKSFGKAALNMFGSVLSIASGGMVLSAEMKRTYTKLMQETTDELFVRGISKVGMPQFKATLEKNRGHFLKRFTDTSTRSISRLTERMNSLISIAGKTNDIKEKSEANKNISLVRDEIKALENELKLKKESLIALTDISVGELEDENGNGIEMDILLQRLDHIKKNIATDKIPRKVVKSLRMGSGARIAQIDRFLKRRRPSRTIDKSIKIRF